jgi:signal peptidase
MKRAIALIFLFIACIAGFLTMKGTLPFMPIFGNSMAPALPSGSLLTIKPVNPANIKVGDIIIYNVPTMVQEYYHYPPVVSHRVIEIKTVPSLSFRTKGDNAGEDPFTIMPMDVRGMVGKQIPYLGLPLFFFQSQQGLIFVIIVLLLLTLFLYGGELLRGGASILAPVINKEKRANRVLTHKIEAAEKKIDTTEHTLGKFTAAIGEYAEHLASHTSAVQGLTEASQELKKGAAEQNRVLMSFVQNMDKARTSPETTAPNIEPPATEKPLPQAQKTARETVKPFHAALNKPIPPGCARKQPKPVKEVPPAKKEIPRAFNRFQSKEELTKEALAAEKEIFSALERLNSRLSKPGDQV